MTKYFLPSVNRRLGDYMKKRIVSIIFAIALVLTSVTALSSCYLFWDYSPVNDYFGQSGQNQGDGNNGGSSNGGAAQQTPSGEIPEPEFITDSEGHDAVLESFSASSKAILSCVTITSNFTKSSYSYGYGSELESSTREYTTEGSGVIYKLDRENGNAYIITNYHVVYSSTSSNTNQISNDIKVYLYGQESEIYAIPATYVGGSMTQDLAVLKVEGSVVLQNSYAVAATIADSDDIAVMDTVIAIGNPEAQGMSVTTGIVSVDSESLGITAANGKTTIALRVIRVSAAINEGNSGGGLFNASGELIGIVNAKKTGSEIDNIGYAIPINIAKNYAESIIYYCNGTTVINPSKCLLGVELTSNILGLDVDAESGRITKREIVEVHALQDGSIVADSVQVGDIVNSITVDGVKREVTRIHQIVDHMLTAKVGSVVVLNITRGEETFDITVNIPSSALTKVE